MGLLISKRKMTLAIAGLLLVVVASGVAAERQQSDSEGAAEQAVSDTDPTDQQRVNKAEQEIADMSKGAAKIRHRLERAREERDVIKVLCLDDKLNQASTAIRSAGDRLGALKLAVEQGDAERTRHESTIVSVLKKRVIALGAESNQCVGEEAGTIGDNRLSVQIEPGMPPEDESLFPSEEFIPLPPPLSSPTK